MATVISKEELDANAQAVIARAWAGEEIVVERDGRTVLRLVPIDEPVAPLGKRQAGRYRGEFSIPADAFVPLKDEELKEWGY